MAQAFVKAFKRANISNHRRPDAVTVMGQFARGFEN